MRPQDFHFELPPELIAQAPAATRAESQLLCVDTRKAAQTPCPRVSVKTLPEQLKQLFGTAPLVVLNDSRVVPARLHLQGPKGRSFELLITAPSPQQGPGARCVAWVRGAKRLRVGDELQGSGLVLRLKGPDPIDPRARVFVVRQGAVMDALHADGELPLPPYIARPQGPGSQDLERYQTVYARSEGSVAAPTAGLHLDKDVLARLDTASITLHVGPGTFLPMEVEDVREHKVGAERVYIRPESAQAILKARALGRPIVAVGTTVTRCLEGVWQAQGSLTPGEHSVDLVITPGFEFQVIQGLMTNFHLPQSSLLMLTCAFGGQERVLAAYAQAVQARLRFYSYGDCMLLGPR